MKLFWHLEVLGLELCGTINNETYHQYVVAQNGLNRRELSGSCCQHGNDTLVFIKAKLLSGWGTISFSKTIQFHTVIPSSLWAYRQGVLPVAWGFIVSVSRPNKNTVKVPDAWNFIIIFHLKYPIMRSSLCLCLFTRFTVLLIWKKVIKFGYEEYVSGGHGNRIIYCYFDS